MKLLFLLLFLFLNFTGTFAQIINGGFEDWNGTEPNGWKTNNSTGSILISKSTDCKNGSFSLANTTMEKYGLVFSGMLYAGSDGKGFTITEKYKYLTGYYKFTAADTNDNIYISIFLYNISATDTTIVGVAPTLLTHSPNFIPFDIEFYYSNNTLMPNLIKITFSMINSKSGFPHLGSAFYIDDLTLTNTVDVKDPSSAKFDYYLSQNYPNPFNPSTKIQYSISSRQFVSLKVYDILGKEISTLVNEEKSAGTYNVTWNAAKFSNGVYFYRMQAGNFVQIKKLVLMK